MLAYDNGWRYVFIGQYFDVQRMDGFIERIFDGDLG